MVRDPRGHFVKMSMGVMELEYHDSGPVALVTVHHADSQQSAEVMLVRARS